MAVVLVECFDRPSWNQAPMLDPLLAVPPALAGIGAATVRRPLLYGAVSLSAALLVALKPTEYAGWLPAATMLTVVLITAVATAGTAASVRQQRRIAEVTSVAEAAQRALLRPPPARLGPLGFDVVYMAAAAEAKVGGDLYEVARTAEHGIRVIIADVRGKGLGAVELAADVLGMFRELAHDACTLTELATRLDTALGRGLGRHEEFVTALLVEIDPESGRTSLFNCGHPAPLLIQEAGPAGTAPAVMEVPAPAPPLGLLTLGDCTQAQLSFDLRPDDRLLLYTDGVTEARDARRAFYPLHERVGVLAARAAAGRAASRPATRTPNKAGLKPVSDDGVRPGLLDLLRADLLRHVGAPLDDDAALLLVRAPASWPAAEVAASASGAPVASAS
ncbi:MAG TPA: PP2C family protein-serine/threonine phosphatase [Trebonia sp.]|nr:PP2C family protein-serine/threonine phosphatase [Trebonia sp.]